MKRKKSRFTVLGGTAAFFLTFSVFVSIAIVVFAAVEDACNGDKAVIAGVMFAVIAVFSAFCTLVDAVRRKFTVDKPVGVILDATDRIAQGDFSVRLDIAHPLNRFDEFDYIKENLNKMAAELARTEVLHTDFVSNVSHEIKTPLAVIQNYAVSLQKKDLDEETRVKYAETLENAAKRLTALITNILRLNKLENQEIKTDYENINLTEQLSGAVLGFEEAIESKGLELDCDFDEGVQVYSSPSCLEIVWNNLLSNAIKFTESGGRISVSLKREDGLVVVKIADTGCGISAETGRHIFEKFYQGDTSHAQEGNGLGLALVKKVIDITGGTITVNSELNKGTVFTVALKTGERA